MAVYSAQNLLGGRSVTDAPMASKTGSAKATPPKPCRKALRSSGLVFVISLPGLLCDATYFSRNSLLRTA